MANPQNTTGEKRSVCCNDEVYLDNDPDVDENVLYYHCNKCSRKCELATPGVPSEEEMGKLPSL